MLIFLYLGQWQQARRDLLLSICNWPVSLDAVVMSQSWAPQLTRSEQGTFTSPHALMPALVQVHCCVVESWARGSEYIINLVSIFEFAANFYHNSDRTRQSSIRGRPAHQEDLWPMIRFCLFPFLVLIQVGSSERRCSSIVFLGIQVKPRCLETTQAVWDWP